MKAAFSHLGRWFRFPLRTLFAIVTALCVVCGWQANIVRQRNIARIGIHSRGGRVEADGNAVHVPGQQYAVWLEQKTLDEEELRIPRWRQWMGDEPIERVILPPEAVEEEVAKVKAMFPEARVILSIAAPPRVPPTLRP